MFREYWRTLDFWKWFWGSRVRFEVKAALGLLLLALTLGGGWLAADRLSSAGASVGTGSFTYDTTVERVVTLHTKGRLVQKVVPIVRTIYRTTTAVQTNIVGHVRTIRSKVVVHVPVLRTKVVTRKGATKLVVTTALVPTTSVVTQALTTTAVSTVFARTRTQTVTQTQTSTVTTTRTVTEPVTSTRTVTTTTTVPTTVTVTQPVTTLP